MTQKITQFNRQECRRLSDAIEQAIKKIGDEFGVHIKRSSGSFTDANYKMKWEASVINENGEIRSREAEDFKTQARLYGLQETDLGKTFSDWTGRKFEITGLTPRRSKYPILAKDVNTGKVFKFPIEQIKLHLNKNMA